ncbi:MAG: twin-arginine translocase subunit TatC [Actinobacteria bacterium]|jgi:sec-independent protein translocase protein TatC|nr:twin-arginine translocase subunit TatC [Actinomycetota bacterium]MCO5300900.1 twin-arginine translocase subunit TatC [Candidatus Nanopelagicales bacterium]MCB9428614.1 twin-arginine translocase subunit TatC [Actinomycetota bacterium]HPE11596.1 twin-arginine translocase subunit TatC [Actinomycetota bacterium]HPJ20441.1 twin-arginine translocase subunit TatC [Actinomycetota bacterium]
MSAPVEHARAQMPLRDHLRELRRRLVISLLAIAAGTVVGWIYYEPIFDVISEPIQDVVDAAAAQGRDVRLVVAGVTDAFMLQVKVAVMAGLVLASPIWIYQLWAFVTPGLHTKERRWVYLFVVLSVPLFLSGVVLAYVLMPKGLEVLLGFTPQNVGNYLPVDRYLSFFIRMVIVFGIGFLTPLFIVGLNMIGVLSGKRLASAWRYIIFGVFVFAAVATPTGDPITMMMLAAPVMVLVGGAVAFSLLNDRRRRRNGAEPDYDSFDDDEVSPIPESVDGEDSARR